MKTFMLVGDVSDNAGPSNVHRELIKHWPEEEELLLPSWANAVSKLISVVVASMRCDVLLTTGSGRLCDMARSIVRKRNVPVVVLVHGYLPYENEVNNLGYADEAVQRWRSVLHGADIVVTNSEFHAECLRAAEPSIADAIRWFNLGVEPFKPCEHAAGDDCITVTVSGGTRPIKGNEVVARAVALLRDQGIPIHLLVFGRSYAENARLEGAVRACGGRMMGQVSSSEFIETLARSDVFVMNSLRESFGMSAIDALAGGASLLVSRNCGVAGILALEDGDIIFDCEDECEVARKILQLAAHPNAQRLYNAMDFDELGWDASARRLSDVCLEALSAASFR